MAAQRSGSSSGSMIGTGFQVIGLAQEYEATVKASRYNENLAIQNSQQALTQGREMERRQRILGRQAIGDIKTGYAASGVALEGSALDVLESSAANAELDALNIRYESQMSARNFDLKAAQESRSRRDAKDAFVLNLATSFAQGAG